MLSLNFADKGKEYVIKRIRGKENIVKRLHEIGVIEGTTIKCINISGSGVIIEVKGTRIALDMKSASKIEVSCASKENRDIFYC